MRCAEEPEAHAHAVLEQSTDRRLKRGAEVGDVARAQRRDATAPRWRIAVFSPESEKSAFGRPSSGRGRAKRVGIAVAGAAASTAGPPG